MIYFCCHADAAFVTPPLMLRSRATRCAHAEERDVGFARRFAALRDMPAIARV